MANIFEATRPDDYLMRLAASHLGQSYKAMATAALDLAEGQSVVDVGCGPGADLLAFSAAVGPHGSVLGIDHDADAVAAAHELVGTAGNVKVSAGDARALDLKPESVDRITHRPCTTSMAPIRQRGSRALPRPASGRTRGARRTGLGNPRDRWAGRSHDQRVPGLRRSGSRAQLVDRTPAPGLAERAGFRP